MVHFCICLLGFLFLIPVLPLHGQSVILKPDESKSKDALIVEGNNAPNPKYVSIAAGTTTMGGQPFSIRSLIQFNYDVIPPGSEIISAKLSLFADPLRSSLPPVIGHIVSPTNTWYIKKNLTSWEENNVIWSNQPLTDSVNFIVMPAPDSALQNYIDIDVTSFVRDEIKDPRNSFGFMIQVQHEVPYHGVSFASSNHPMPELWPEMKIEYRPAVPTIYNVITRNNDGKNEAFEIDYPATSAGIEVTVFNGWGERVYHSDNYKNDWNGEQLPDGTYYYVVKVMDVPYTGELWISR